MCCLMDLTRCHLPLLTPTAEVNQTNVVHMGCHHFQVTCHLLPPGDYTEDEALRPHQRKPAACHWAHRKLVCRACSACGSGSTALTALGGPLTPWDSLGMYRYLDLHLE